MCEPCDGNDNENDYMNMNIRMIIALLNRQETDGDKKGMGDANNNGDANDYDVKDD